jgi:hypothetical protein
LSTTVAAIYTISPTERCDQLSVDLAWEQPALAPLDPEYAQLAHVSIGSKPHLIAVAPEGRATLYALLDRVPFFEPVPCNLNFGGGVDAVEGFVLGNRTFVLGYFAKQGRLRFYEIGSRGECSDSFEYARLREPGLSIGWTMIAPLVYLKQVFLAAYSFDTGAVDLLKVTAAATSPLGVPPLDVSTVWSWTWARGWTRFAWFTMGGENFFLKTNVLKPNVNIDHLSDDPKRRSGEIGTHLILEDAADLTLVKPFCMAGGAPHFVSTRGDGKAVWYRIHPDCQGWTAVARTQVMAGASELLCYTAGDRRFALFSKRGGVKP